MKTTMALLMLLALSLQTAFAQEDTQMNLPDGAIVRLGKGSVEEILYSPDGSRLAVCGSIGIWLYDTATYRNVALLDGYTGGDNRAVFSPDGTTLASGGDDTTVRMERRDG